MPCSATWECVQGLGSARGESSGVSAVEASCDAGLPSEEVRPLTEQHQPLPC